MIEDTAQSLKVEQDDVGQVLDAVSRFKPVKLALVAAGENSSPFKGHKATGRSREYLTSSEMAKLIDAAKASKRNSHRNYMAVLLTFRHGLRASEAADLRWSDISLEDGTIFAAALRAARIAPTTWRGMSCAG